MKFKNTALLALLSAFLMWLAWPPIKFTTLLLLIGLVPLLIALERIIQSDSPKKGKRVFLTAGLTFLIWNTASIYWVYNAISAVNGPLVSFFVSLIPYGLGALLMTFAFWLYYRLGRLVNKYIAYLGLICIPDFLLTPLFLKGFYLSKKVGKHALKNWLKKKEQ